MRNLIIKLSVLTVMVTTYVIPGYAGIITYLNSLYSLDPNKHYSQKEIIDKWNKILTLMTDDYTYQEKRDNMGVYYVVTNRKDK